MAKKDGRKVNKRGGWKKDLSEMPLRCNTYSEIHRCKVLCLLAKIVRRPTVDTRYHFQKLQCSLMADIVSFVRRIESCYQCILIKSTSTA